MQSVNFKVVAATLSQIMVAENTPFYIVELLVTAPSTDSVRVVIGQDKFDAFFTVLEIKSLSELTYIRLLKEDSEEQYSIIANIVGDRALSLKAPQQTEEAEEAVPVAE